METLDERDARDEKISAWLDGELDDDARAAFERELEADPALAAEVRELQRALSALSTLRASPPPPEDFLRAVEGKINRRSRGRFFDQPEAKMRVPYEVFAALMLIVLAAAWFYARPDDTAPDRGMAMGSSAPPAPAPPEAPAPPDGAAPANPAPVAPLRREVIHYGLTLPANGPAPQAADQLAARIRATSRAFEVQSPKPGALSVSLPADQVDDFLSAFGQGGQVQRHRLTVDGAHDQARAVVRVTFQEAP